MKALKVIFIILFLLILAGMVGGYFFLKSFDLNKYKDQIVSKIEEATGRKANIDSLKLNFSW